MISRNSKAVRPGQAGFTLIELIVALGVTAIVMLGILFLFDFNNKLTRVQANVADMQQSLRIAQYDMVRMVRMAGRGGITAAGSLEIADNVPAGTLITGGNPPKSEKVLEGTDILTMRGVFTTPIYQVAFTEAGAFMLTGGPLNPPTPASATGGFIELCNETPAGTAQAIALLAAPDRGLSDTEELVLVNPLDDRFFVVVKVNPGASHPETETCPRAPDNSKTGFTLGFKIERNGNPTHRYGLLSPELTSDAELGLSRVAYVGFLERYSFYIQESHAVTGDAASELTPVLCRASFIRDEVELCQQVADGVLDLQIALGVDTTNDGTVSENPATPNLDEWLGNGDNEIVAPDAANPAYQTYANLINNNLKSLRISTLVRTRRPDNTFEAEDLPRIENHAYDLGAGADLVNGTTARKYRRRMLQTLVNLRNLTS